MPEVILNCPKCQRQLRVTDELIGRPVKCPACGLTFTIPAGGTEPQLAPVPVLEEAPRRPLEQEEAYPSPSPYDTGEAGPGGRPLDFEHVDTGRARFLIMPPAIILLVLTTIGFLVNLYQIFNFHMHADEIMKEVQQRLKEMNFQAPLPAPSVIQGINISLAVISLLSMLAAVQMLRLRWYPFAVAGSFLPILNCAAFCCVPCFPFCIWAFIVLLRPEVRNAFR